MQPGRHTGPFDGQDWSRFDFSRWHFDGLPLEAPAAAVAQLVQQLFASPEWQQRIASSLPALKTGVLRHFERQVKALQAQKATLAADLEARTTAMRAQITAAQDRIRGAAAPPRLTADPHSFLLGTKVIEEQTGLGIPGLVVRLMHPRQKNHTLAEGVTDLDGNVVLSLSEEQTEALAREQVEPTVEILTPSGKLLDHRERVSCPRVNSTETPVVRLRSSADLEPHLTEAQRAKTERETRLAGLHAKIDRLRTEHDAVQDMLQSQLQEVETIIARLKQELGSAASWA